MKRLLLVLVFVALVGCATTSQPVSHTDMRVDAPQSEEAKEAGERWFWHGFHALSLYVFWPF